MRWSCFCARKRHTINLIGPETTPTSEGLTKEQQGKVSKANADAKQVFLDEASKNPPDKVSTDSSPNTSPQKGSLTLSAEKSSATHVTVLTKIMDITDGNCELAVSNGTKNTTQTAPVIFQPEFSSCAGFSVPVSQLGTGQWVISVTVKPVSGDSINSKIELRVD
ncbi:hypothetical protein IPL68_02565 [Candidatus Saccharibacteria bacterium]|nr:MAG: hypothetical protein IPL68_02565 [Candidatus Saccharibacteria bacterium]